MSFKALQRALDAFTDWFYRHLLYAALGLRWEDGLSDLIQERTGWMLAQAPQALSPRTREELKDYAWKFIVDWILAGSATTSLTSCR